MFCFTTKHELVNGKLDLLKVGEKKIKTNPAPKNITYIQTCEPKLRNLKHLRTGAGRCVFIHGREPKHRSCALLSEVL